MQSEVDMTTLHRRPIDKEQNGLAREALAFIRGFSWCDAVLDLYEGIADPDILGVFLTRIRPARPDVDEWLWIIVGDLPPAYLVTDRAPNPACALDGYIGLMREWVNAAERGASVDDLIPVNVPPTREYAKMLGGRLRVLSEFLQENFRDDLQAGAEDSTTSAGKKQSLRPRSSRARPGST